jgi:hypothetical protein
MQTGIVCICIIAVTTIKMDLRKIPLFDKWSLVIEAGGHFAINEASYFVND